MDEIIKGNWDKYLGKYFYGINPRSRDLIYGCMIFDGRGLYIEPEDTYCDSLALKPGDIIYINLFEAESEAVGWMISSG